MGDPPVWVQTVVVPSQVCRTQNDVLSTAEQWKDGSEGEGLAVDAETFERS